MASCRLGAQQDAMSDLPQMQFNPQAHVLSRTSPLHSCRRRRRPRANAQPLAVARAEPQLHHHTRPAPSPART
jgi:hypothetical protein